MPPDIEQKRTLRGYLEEVASGTPAPGGGSVAATVGALGAALGEMVVNLTLVRRQYANAAPVLEPVRHRLTVLREALADAAAADERAYAAYRAASALPRGSDGEKAARGEAMQQALLEATEVPLDVARAAAEVAELLETVAQIGNPSVRSDAALGALLAEAAVRGALLNARGNAALLRDRERADTFLADADLIEERGREAAHRAFRIATRNAVGDAR
jgi:glutamate formiminotransferase/formiminotetrahydrofolate cyclodeaminase